MDVQAAERTARACQELQGGAVLRLSEPLLPGPLWESVEPLPTGLKSPLSALFGAAQVAALESRPETPVAPEKSRVQPECESCEAFGEIRRWLESESQKLQDTPGAPLWVVPDSRLEPWEWLGILSWDYMEESSLYLASFIAVIDADRFWADWVSAESADATDPDSPTLAHRLCGLVEFADDWVLEGASASDHGLAAFLGRLNPDATVHVPAEDCRAMQTLGLRALAKVPGAALDAPRAVWRARLMQGPSQQAPESVTVFRSRRPFHPERLHALLSRWPEDILRTEGTLWLASHPQLAFHVSQVGPSSFELASEGEWLAFLPPKELSELRSSHPEIFDHWDPQYGDRQNELVFVWDDSRNGEFESELAACVLGDFEMRMDWSRFQAPQ